jgi:hypothetical protein
MIFGQFACSLIFSQALSDIRDDGLVRGGVPATIELPSSGTVLRLVAGLIVSPSPR